MSRRGLLLGARGVASLAACGGPSAPSGPTPSPSTTTSATSLPIDSKVFCIAHRGGGKNWPEMTAHAYQQASRLKGLTAMEVSVHRSKDGVLVCHHDADTLRVTGTKLVIAQSTWKQLAELRVSAKDTLDPTQPSRPIARFEEVLDLWPRQMTMWVEPKSDDAVEQLFQLCLNYPDIKFVWKRPVNAPFERAYLQGWGTFGYVLAGEQQMRLMRTAATQRYIQYFGVPTTATDAVVKQVVDECIEFGKKAVMWPLNNTIDRDRALAAGITGLMCSDIKNLLIT